MTTEDAYRQCLEIARNHYENFPVASWLVPSRFRGPIAAIYAFARRADDVADEGASEPHERLRQLDELRQRLLMPSSGDPVDVALTDTMRRFSLPPQVFERLLDAFVSDVSHTPFTSWQHVMSYCSNSADPVGELLVRLDHAPDEPPADAISASNAVCTALQITNFLQDAAVDERRGRSYLPLDDAEMIRRTYELYDEGRLIVRHLRSTRLRWEVALTIAGGVTMLDMCRMRSSRDVRPALKARHLLRLIGRVVDVFAGKPLSR